MDVQKIVEQVLDYAKEYGATEADAVMAKGTSFSWEQRMGRLEGNEFSEAQDMGLRVLVGKRQAIVSSSDVSSESLKILAQRAVEMAKIVPEDPYVGLANAEDLYKGQPIDFDTCSDDDITMDKLKEIASEVEDVALSVEGITNSSGSGAEFSKSESFLGASNGYSKFSQRTSISFGVGVIAGTGNDMQSDGDYSYAIYAEDLRTPKEVGLRASKRTLDSLNPQKMKTAQVPVIFDKRVAPTLLGHFLGAINGRAIVRKSSFLENDLHKDVFSSSISIIDNPHRIRGFSSRFADAEGIGTKEIKLVDKGNLQTWLLSLTSARALEMETTGHGSRGISSAPSASSSNVHIEASDVSVKDLIGDIKEGFLVTSLIGMGVNGLTGDYSRGASGFWIENGIITHSVSEMTIAGNLKEMFKNMTPADDLEFIQSTNAPTIRIEGMTVAGL